MPTNPQTFKPGEFCQLINSTSSGEVLTDSQLRRQRNQAGLRIGTGSRIDMLKYTAWLVGLRHLKKGESTSTRLDERTNLHDAARGAAAISRGPTGSKKQDAMIAAVLTEPTMAAAARLAGVSESTLYRCMNQSGFRKTLERTKKELVDGSVGRLQAASGVAVETLKNVARNGRRETDRVRASAALLDHIWRGLARGDLLPSPSEQEDRTPSGSAEVVQLLSARLQQLDDTSLSTPEKYRLSVSLAKALLQAVGVDQIEKRLAAVENVLGRRKESA